MDLWRLVKGYPEYNPGQSRGDDGQWTGSSGSPNPRKLNVKAEADTEATQAAVQSMIDAFPQKHFEKLRDHNLEVLIAKDLSKVWQGLAALGYVQAISPDARVAPKGFFTPMGKRLILTLGETFYGHKLSDVGRTFMHEAAHALDWISGDTLGDKATMFSTKLAGVMAEEAASLSSVQRWYAEHYKAAQHPREFFAEIYTAIYSPPSSSTRFLGSMTQKEVLDKFPRSVAAIKGLTKRRIAHNA